MNCRVLRLMSRVSGLFSRRKRTPDSIVRSRFAIKAKL